MTGGDDPRSEAWRLLREQAHRPEVLARGHVVAEAAGVTPTLAKAIAHLSADRPTPMREMASALRCDASYVTTVVDGLEEHGLARRLPHPTDRRVKVVSLTPAGAELAEQIRSVIDRPPASMDVLSDDEVTTLLALMRKLADAGAAVATSR